MSEKELTSGKIGTVGSYELDKEAGVIRAKASISLKEGPLSVELPLVVGLDLVAVLELLKGHGVLADAALSIAEQAAQTL